MKLIMIVGLMILLSSCGDSNLKIKAPEEDVLSGESYSYVILQFEFIKEMRQLCEDINYDGDFESDKAKAKVVAQCTLDNLSILDSQALDSFRSGVCSDPEPGQESEICDNI